MAVVDPLRVTHGVEIPASEVAMEFARASGPGGQHVNKTETRVTLRFALARSPSIPRELKERMIERLASRLTKSGEILVTSGSRRDRSQNMDEAWSRLEMILRRAAMVPKPRKKTRPSRGAKERRLSEKRRTAQRKEGRRSPRGDD
jgi:ribosome-associated protein